MKSLADVLGYDIIVDDQSTVYTTNKLDELNVSSNATPAPVLPLNEASAGGTQAPTSDDPVFVQLQQVRQCLQCLDHAVCAAAEDVLIVLGPQCTFGFHLSRQPSTSLWADRARSLSMQAALRAGGSALPGSTVTLPPPAAASPPNWPATQSPTPNSRPPHGNRTPPVPASPPTSDSGVNPAAIAVPIVVVVMVLLALLLACLCWRRRRQRRRRHKTDVEEADVDTNGTNDTMHVSSALHSADKSTQARSGTQQTAWPICADFSSLCISIALPKCFCGCLGL